jgi:hypothetical protein
VYQRNFGLGLLGLNVIGLASPWIIINVGKPTWRSCVGLKHQNPSSVSHSEKRFEWEDYGTMIG